MKKLLYTLSTLAVTASPVVTVIACSNENTGKTVEFEKVGDKTTITLNIGSSDISNGSWKTPLTEESKYVSGIFNTITNNSDDISSSSSVDISLESSGYQAETIQADSLIQFAHAPENVTTPKILDLIKTINLSEISGGNPGGEISEDRYDFDFGSSNPDSTDRPTTIAALKSSVPGYYDSLSDTATGDALFKELQTVQAKYRDNVGSYAQLWDHYEESFVDKWDENDGSIWDIYGEVPSTSHGDDPHGTSGDDMRPFQPGSDQDSGSGGGSEGNAYNREHIIPQSYFNSNGSSSQGIKNDPHFTLPADKRVNSQRSNYSFGEVSTIENTYHQNSWAAKHSGEEVNGGVLGTSSLTGSKVFEPIDWFKGDVARASMHFLVTWTDSSSFDGNPVANFETFKTKADMEFPYFSTQDYADLYLEWNMNDPVDQYNVDVNNSLSSSYEGHLKKQLVLRNPFVDMPELAELIWA